MKNNLSKLFYAFAVVMTSAAISISAQVASGGAYTLNQTVVASGGGTSGDAGNLYKIEGTAGQSAAGTSSEAGAYTMRGGFWSPNPFAPTAASASIGGRVMTAQGAGIRNVTVILMGGNLLTPRTTRTTTFGYFNFEDMTVGQIYVVSVISKKYGFAQSSRAFSLLDNITDVVFQSNWEN